MRSARATLALNAFSALAKYFSGRAQMAEALGWSPDTTSAWEHGRVVRPQVRKMREVSVLLQLAEEAAAYMHRDTDVGDWITSPTPTLHGHSPAERLAEPGGLSALQKVLFDAAPRRPGGTPAAIEEGDEACPRIAGADADVAELMRMIDAIN